MARPHAHRLARQRPQPVWKLLSKDHEQWDRKCPGCWILGSIIMIIIIIIIMTLFGIHLLNCYVTYLYASAQRSMSRGTMVLSCLSVRVSVCASQNIVDTILQSIWRIFTKLMSTMRYGTEMNASQFNTCIFIVSRLFCHRWWVMAAAHVWSLSRCGWLCTSNWWCRAVSVWRNTNSQRIVTSIPGHWSAERQSAAAAAASSAWR